jgi:6-phosphogluconate dehydrogenase (decarboxylating)
MGRTRRRSHEKTAKFDGAGHYVKRVHNGIAYGVATGFSTRLSYFDSSRPAPVFRPICSRPFVTFSGHTAHLFQPRLLTAIAESMCPSIDDESLTLRG